jgi:hypothetical protein
MQDAEALDEVGESDEALLLAGGADPDAGVPVLEPRRRARIDAQRVVTLQLVRPPAG